MPGSKAGIFIVRTRKYVYLKKENLMGIFLAVAVFGFIVFIANLLPVLGHVVVGFFKYVVFPIIIILALCLCFSH